MRRVLFAVGVLALACGRVVDEQPKFADSLRSLVVLTDAANVTRIREKTQQLLQGPLTHIKAAALAAALLPLAYVAATPAAAQTVCTQSGGVCGVVFNDANNNGIQDVGDTGIEGVNVIVCQLCDGTDTTTIPTGTGGFYSLFVPGGPS